MYTNYVQIITQKNKYNYIQIPDQWNLQWLQKSRIIISCYSEHYFDRSAEAAMTYYTKNFCPYYQIYLKVS